MTRTNVHPIELALVVLLLVLEAAWLLARTVLVPLAALALTTAGWRPTQAAPQAQASAAAVDLPIPASSSTRPPLAHPLQELAAAAAPTGTVAQLRQQARAAGLPRAWCRIARREALLALLSGLEVTMA